MPICPRLSVSPVPRARFTIGFGTLMSHRVCYITPSVVQLWGCIANVYAMLSFGGAAEQRSSGRVTSLYGSVAAALKVSV